MDNASDVSYPRQQRFNESGVELRSRIDEPVDPTILEKLQTKVPDFRRAYEPDGMAKGDFVDFGAMRKILHQFIGEYERLLGFVRGVMVPA